jgi:hypothetical protein
VEKLTKVAGEVGDSVVRHEERLAEKGVITSSADLLGVGNDIAYPPWIYVERNEK